MAKKNSSRSQQNGMTLEAFAPAHELLPSCLRFRSECAKVHRQPDGIRARKLQHCDELTHLPDVVCDSNH